MHNIPTITNEIKPVLACSDAHLLGLQRDLVSDREREGEREGANELDPLRCDRDR